MTVLWGDTGRVHSGSHKSFLINYNYPSITYVVNKGAWRANIAYALNDEVYAYNQAPNGFIYQCTTAGTSAAGAGPTWPTTAGSTVADGTVVWTAVTAPANLVLPTTAPAQASAQVSMTIQQSDLPSITGSIPNSWIWCAELFLSGMNTNTLASKFNYTAYVNGVQVTTGVTSTANQNYYLGTTFGATDLHVGDVITICVWASQTGHYLDWYGMRLMPSRIVPTKTGMMLTDLNIVAGISNLFQYESTGYNPQQTIIVGTVNSTPLQMGVSNSPSNYFPGLVIDDTYGITRTYWGDMYNTPYGISAQNVRNIPSQTRITQVSFREYAR